MLSLTVGSSAAMASKLVSMHPYSNLHSANVKLPTTLSGLKDSQLQQHQLFMPNRSIFSFKACVASVDSDRLTPSNSTDKQEAKKYYFVVANAKFMLDEEEHFKELLFERRRYFEEQNKEQDFWLVVEPKLLDKFPNITKRLKRPAVALVSTNGPWITFMKLRLDRVLADSYEADSIEEALASSPATLEFDKPEKWTAPYPKYEYGWWETFLPSASKESKV